MTLILADVTLYCAVSAAFSAIACPLVCDVPNADLQSDHHALQTNCTVYHETMEITRSVSIATADDLAQRGWCALPLLTRCRSIGKRPDLYSVLGGGMASGVTSLRPPTSLGSQPSPKFFGCCSGLTRHEPVILTPALLARLMICVWLVKCRAKSESLITGCLCPRYSYLMWQTNYDGKHSATHISLRNPVISSPSDNDDVVESKVDFGAKFTFTHTSNTIRYKELFHTFLYHDDRPGASLSATAALKPL